MQRTRIPDRKRARPPIEDRSAAMTMRVRSVGAYARRERRWRFLMGLFGVALILGAVSLAFVLRPADGGRSVPVPAAYECVQCGQRGQTQVIAGTDPFPVQCPTCNVRSGQRLWECRDCGRQFLRKGGDAVVACTRCGSERVGAAEEPRPQDADPNGR